MRAKKGKNIRVEPSSWCILSYDSIAIENFHSVYISKGRYQVYEKVDEKHEIDSQICESELCNTVFTALKSKLKRNQNAVEKCK